VTFRDRDGLPRCGQCLPGDGRDPAAVIAEIVAAIELAVPAECLRAGQPAPALLAGRSIRRGCSSTRRHAQHVHAVSALRAGFVAVPAAR
jgi:hypothetical protein